VWDSFDWVWWSEYLFCVGHFEVGLVEWVFVVCGTFWCGFCGVSFVVCGTVLIVFGGVSVCFLFDISKWVWWSGCFLCVGYFGVGFFE
jgi:hypothetical protein